MHLEERNMSCSLTAAKPIFPVPINGQTLMFSATNGHSNRCDHGRGTIHALPHTLNHSRCSCEAPPPTQGYSNRLLLPATSHNDQIRVQANLPTSLSADSWLRIPAGSRPNYESLLLNGFPLYGKFNNDSYPSLDYALLANARRKNATRETTSTLKAWLNEHKKNPYPTKGEKIMLAILTKMTLTQVSTWFANARRRLKKENKMTWSPRKKTGEKKGSGKFGDESCTSDSDVECMDVDVDGIIDQPQETTSVLSVDKIEPASCPVTTERAASEIQRPSVIRTLESPTFNEIRDRFKDKLYPVTDLQKWVNCCAKTEEINDFVEELTPPSTPIENKITTFSAQTLFEAFDAAKHNSKSASDVSVPPSVESSYNKEPLHLIFSSKPPVCSPKVVVTQSEQTTGPNIVVSPCQTVNESNGLPADIITPQPSPKNNTQFVMKNFDVDPKPEVRVQGLTTSRELEAVLALTNLCKP